MPFGSRRRTDAEPDDRYSALSDRIAQILRLAQDEADKMIAEARAEADRIVAEARVEAGQIRAGDGVTGSSGADKPVEPF